MKKWSNSMDKNEAEMLARAICNEQDQRERDSKLVPSQRDILRQQRTRLREMSNHDNQIKVGKDIQNEVDLMFFFELLLGILFIITFCFNMKLIMLLCSAALITFFSMSKHREVKLSKKYQTQWTKNKVDTSIWNIFIVATIFGTIICEAILFFLFN